jgi:hypothetical protein
VALIRKQPTGALLCLAALWLVPACKSEVAPEHPARIAPPGHAELPPVPDLDPFQPPDRYPDGALSVHGLQTAAKGTLPPEVQVRGTVAVLHPCPLTEKICKPAPFLYLTDAKTGQGKRLLVGGERDLDARGWKQGQQVTLTGRFAMGSEDGTWFAPQGMLLLSPLPPPVDPNATPDAK